MDDYQPADRIIDAAKFARSRYGKHYLLKLNERVEECKRNAVDLKLTRDERADWGIRASEAQRQVDYFKASESTASNPSLIKKLRDKWKQRKLKDETA